MQIKVNPPKKLDSVPHQPVQRQWSGHCEQTSNGLTLQEGRRGWWVVGSHSITGPFTEAVARGLIA